MYSVVATLGLTKCLGHASLLVVKWKVKMEPYTIPVRTAEGNEELRKNRNSIVHLDR